MVINGAEALKETLLHYRPTSFSESQQHLLHTTVIIKMETVFMSTRNPTQCRNQKAITG